MLGPVSQSPMKRITSRHHPLVSRSRDLARGRGPEHSQDLLLDGAHLVAEARQALLRVHTVVVTSRAASTAAIAELLDLLRQDGTEIVEASDSVMAAMSPVAVPSGVVAIASRPASSLDRVLTASAPLVVVACDIQDPGNVGAVIRAAEAAGADGAILCGSSADPFGWKALRGAMGSSLRLPLACGLRTDEAVAACRGRGLAVVAATPRAGASMYDYDFRSPAALVLGGEGPGLPAAIADAADARVFVPMREPVESLNVAVAAALLVYEAARQRRKAEGSSRP